MQERAEEKESSGESKDVLEMSEETPRGCAEEKRQEEKEARHVTPPIKRMLAKRLAVAVPAAGPTTESEHNKIDIPHHL